MSVSSTVSFASLSINRRQINGALRGARNATMLSLIGNPRGTYDQSCRYPTNQRIVNLTTRADVGPFELTGLKPAVETLRTIFSEVKTEAPNVYDVLGNVGMLCCRFVRGSNSAISNHSWGTAVDLTLNGRLDNRGDGRTQKGLLEIYNIFNRHGFFWGAAFTTEDCMHFEASDQLVRQWYNDGLLGESNGQATSSVLEYGDRGPEVAVLQEKLNIVLALDLDLDGVFGPATKAAVMEFQRLNGLVVDGVVGQNTKAKLGI